MSKAKYYIFRYGAKGVVSTLVFMKGLEVLVEELGWVRDCDFQVRVVGVASDHELQVVECDNEGIRVKNGLELTINYQQFYQGDKLDKV